MPWVRLDDRFPAHRKIRMLSDRAFRLYVSGLCWSSENLTDGRIPASELRIVADITSGKAAAKELVARGLWELQNDGNFLIHDYHDYNPTAEQVRADRAAKTERQARWRANKKGSDKPGDPAPAVDAVDGDVDASTQASRDASGDAAPEPVPVPQVPPTEVPTDWQPPTGDIPIIGTGPRIPVNARELVDTITRAGMVVGWDLATTDWFVIEALLKRCGTQALVDDAAKSWSKAREPVRSGKYFLPAWRKLPDIPEDVRNLPVMANGPALPPPVDAKAAQRNEMRDHLTRMGHDMRQQRLTQEGQTA